MKLAVIECGCHEAVSAAQVPSIRPRRRSRGHEIGALNLVPACTVRSAMRRTFSREQARIAGMPTVDDA